MTFTEWEMKNRADLIRGRFKEGLEAAWQAAQQAEREKYKDLLDYLQHDSWRCGYHGECHCGLNDLLESLNLEPIPLPEK